MNTRDKLQTLSAVALWVLIAIGVAVAHPVLIGAGAWFAVSVALTMRSALFEAASRPSKALRGADPYATPISKPRDLLEPYSVELSRLRRLHAEEKIPTEMLVAHIESIDKSPAAKQTASIARQVNEEWAAKQARENRRPNTAHVPYCPGYTGGVCNQPGPCAGVAGPATRATACPSIARGLDSNPSVTYHPLIPTEEAS